MQNEPNSRRGRLGWAHRGVGRGANRAKRTQFAGESCETKPTSGGRDTPPFHYSIIPPSQSDAYRAKRTQSPAGPGGTRLGGRGTRDKCAKRTQFFDCGLRISDCGFRKACGLPPRLRQAYRAKQTQFGPAWPGRRARDAKQSQLPPGRSRAGTPNPRRVDHAKQTQFGGRNMRNEPNFARCCCRGLPSFQYSIIPPFRSNADCAKRTQSGPAGGRDTPPVQYSIIPAFQSDAYRAKQSQFPGFGPPGGSGVRRRRATASWGLGPHRTMGRF